MRSLISFLFVLLITNQLMIGSVLAQLGQPFPKPSALPFEDLAVKQQIDKQCGPAGTSNNAVKIAQTRAKNNFWETAQPVPIDFGIFRELEDKTNASIANNTVHTVPITQHGDTILFPADRTELGITHNGTSYKEGTLVTLEAFIVRSQYADTKYNSYNGSGEEVNCGKPWLSWNDIHIDLGTTKNAAQCDRVTAEISPHYRPKIWSRFQDGSEPKINQKVRSLPLVGQKVRLTGQLFYDSSHKACKDGHSQGAPVRMTIWEMHPLYRIQILDKDTNVWLDLDKWVAQNHL